MRNLNIKIIPKKLNGHINAISSKSHVHRLLIASALSDNPTKIYSNVISKDIKATIYCLKALGSNIKICNNSITIYPINKSVITPFLDCNESGSTARFLLPVASALYDKCTFTGNGKLPLRPFSPLINEMKNNGCKFSNNVMPFTTYGNLKAGTYKIDGNVSSQFISGLMFALPILDGDSKIVLNTPLQSSGYVNMTIDTLNHFKINVTKIDNCYFVKGNQKYISPKEIYSDADWSNSAFWICANAMGCNININKLNYNSLQNDKTIIEILDKFKTPNKEIQIDGSEIPDIIPILCVVASVYNGATTFYNISRLRIKESDRIITTVEMIKSLGGDIKIINDCIIINGKNTLLGGTVNSYNDHRIAMSAAIASCVCEKPVVIKDALAVEKSYPEFYKDFKKLGGYINVI